MRIKIFILTYLFLFFGAGSVFATAPVISNTPTIVNVGSEFSVTASMSGLSKNTIYRLRIAFGSNNYFGSTFNGSTWYNGSPSPINYANFLSITTDGGGSWSGNIQGKIESPDPNYKSVSGAYDLKVGRYTENGTSATWSNIVQITIVTSASTPTPTPTPSSTTTPTVTSTQSPTSGPSNSSSFTISNIPSQIDSDQSFNTSVNLSLPNSPNATYYLSGAFKIVDGTRYFGLTKINSDWISYSSENFSNQYKITTDSFGVWNGNLEVKPDTADSDYKGTGDYVFKVARYTLAGSQTWSNDGTIKIIGTAQGSDSSETLSNDPPSPSSTDSPKVKSIVTASQSKVSTKTEYKIASVAGVTTTASSSATPSTEIKSQKQTNFPLVIGLILITSGMGLSSYIYLRSHETIFNKFRNRN